MPIEKKRKASEPQQNERAAGAHHDTPAAPWKARRVLFHTLEAVSTTPRLTMFTRHAVLRSAIRRPTFGY